MGQKSKPLRSIDCAYWKTQAFVSDSAESERVSGFIAKFALPGDGAGPIIDTASEHYYKNAVLFLQHLHIFKNDKAGKVICDPGNVTITIIGNENCNALVNYLNKHNVDHVNDHILKSLGCTPKDASHAAKGAKPLEIDFGPEFKKNNDKGGTRR